MATDEFPYNDPKPLWRPEVIVFLIAGFVPCLLALESWAGYLGITPWSGCTADIINQYRNVTDAAYGWLPFTEHGPVDYIIIGHIVCFSVFVFDPVSSKTGSPIFFISNSSQNIIEKMLDIIENMISWIFAFYLTSILWPINIINSRPKIKQIKKEKEEFGHLSGRLPYIYAFFYYQIVRYIWLLLLIGTAVTLILLNN